MALSWRHRLTSLIFQARSAASTEVLELLQLSGTSQCCRREFSKVPQEYQQFYNAPAAQRTSAPRPQPQEEASQRAEATTSAPEPPSSTNPTRVWMFPWERRQIEGSGPLRGWEKVYWGIFVSAIAVYLFSRTHSSPPEKADDPEASRRREDQKKQAARAVLAGKSFTESGDVFEGLSPREIQEYVAKVTDGATSQDPFEGLSPDEINDYLAKQKG